MPRPAPAPDTQLAEQEAVELTERFMEELDEGQRAVFVLALLEGLPAGEVAVALGVPTNTVYSRIRLIRQKFRELLAHHYQETLR
jgi:RNA polymerase sigma-70 factor (ECF subfamily)